MKSIEKNLVGKVLQIIGVVIDVEFKGDTLPAIYEALEVKRKNGKVTCSSGRFSGVSTNDARKKQV